MTRPPRELEERGQFPKRTRKRRRPSISKYLSVSNVKGLVVSPDPAPLLNYPTVWSLAPLF